ncbi:MAG: nucleotidyl transferase AbiEii/AbiGii toxin family protein [Microbacteriaceae bacterium]|nr:nucleotidyl transferase AbiEii/AbiGii toxin family protein [Microbacteriaceae bacterium]
MAGNEHQMDPDEVRHLLDVLERRLTAEGIDAEVHVIGGSAMALLFPDDSETRFTTDIDAVVAPRTAVVRVVEQIAVDLGLSPTWLNSSGAPFVPPRARSTVAPPGVTVTVATIDELIAMKLAASRDQDLFDLGILARHAGITDPERLVDITFDAYGEDSLVLVDTRADYLIMARQAMDAERKRARRRPKD